MDPLLHDSLSLCFLCFPPYDWLLMVRMRSCAEGAQAPHWLPLCSCYCCHCSCAVSGQSHNAHSLSLTLCHYFRMLDLVRNSCFFFPWCFKSCLLPYFHVPALFHYFIFFPLLFHTSSHLLLPLILYHHLTSPSQLTSLSLTDFELQAILFVLFPINHYLSSSVYWLLMYPDASKNRPLTYHLHLDFIFFCQKISGEFIYPKFSSQV